jgi:hypothetical protein
MGRRPADQPRRFRGHEHFWKVIMDLHGQPGPFTVRDVYLETNAHKDTVRDYLKRLVRAEILSREVTDPRQPDLFRVLKPQRDAPSVTREGKVRTLPTGTEQMWRTMKMRSSFTAAELADGASTDEVQIALETAKTYCRHLKRAGYLVITTPAAKNVAGTDVSYRLLPSMMTGPRAPLIQRVKRVFDPNLGRVMRFAEDGDDQSL